MNKECYTQLEANLKGIVESWTYNNINALKDNLDEAYFNCKNHLPSKELSKLKELLKDVYECVGTNNLTINMSFIITELISLGFNINIEQHAIEA